MNDFPARTLLSMADAYDQEMGVGTNGARDLRQAVKAYEELAERCVMDAVKASLEIANLRARLREIDPQFPTA